MKRLLLYIFLFLTAAAQAQTGSYSFTRWTEPYVSIAGQPGTVSTPLLGRDDTTITSIPIGFTFLYCSSGSYTTLSACSNGWLSLSNSPQGGPVSSANHDYTASIAAIGTGIGLIMPFWDDLSGGVGPPGGPIAIPAMAYYQTSGTAPNRVFTFQWGDPTNPWHSYLGSGDATFQVKLYETSGVIEFHYGVSTYSMKTATIGICNSASDYRTLYNEAVTAPTPIFEYHIDTTPELNTVMEWAPPCPTASIPPASTGPGTVCQASDITLANSTPGGVWLSSSVSVATVGSSTGVVTGVAGGVVIITYKVSPGCFAVSTVTVNPLPDTIGGGPNFCENNTTTLTCVTTGGTWSSSDVSVGTVSTSGGFTGVTSGTTTISYTVATGCARTLDATVNPSPTITGSNVACLTDTTVLTSLVPGGTWTSGNTARAVVDAAGNVMGVSLGSVIISYTAPTGCVDTILMTVGVDCDNAVRDVANKTGALKVYPQPARSDVWVVAPVTGEATIEVADVYGKTLASERVELDKGVSVKVPGTAKLPPGTYALRVSVGEYTWTNKITIIQ
ncbi:MAG: hypothetical protein KF744_14065 [Taibaiella sp.]|nr:hypothetical protein [Taibaiella sp.]